MSIVNLGLVKMGINIYMYVTFLLPVMYLAEKIKILFTVAVAVKAVCKYCSSFRL
jgi:hypothetical protein